jgi:hypothetical protein
LQTINLIPRKPWIEENAKKAIVTIIILVMIILLVQLLAVGNLAKNKDGFEQKLQQTDKQIAVQSQKRIPDSTMSRVTQLRKEIDKIILSRTNWLPIFANLVGTLPNDSHLDSMNISDEKLISLNIKFKDDLEVIRYVKQLQASTVFNNVKIDKLVYMSPAVREPTTGPIITQPPTTSEEFFIPDDEDTQLRKELQQLLENLNQPLDDAFIQSDSPFLNEDSPFDLEDLKLPINDREPEEEEQVEQELPVEPYYELVVHIKL